MMYCANPSAQFKSHQAEIEEAVLSVMRGNCYVLGNEVENLEQEFARYIGTQEAIGVASGTDAIELALRALGIGLGDEVITVSHTAVATVAAIEATGASPVLVDIEPEYYSLAPSQLEVVVTPSVKAVIAVHLYGQAADLDEISIFCKQHDLFLIEDVSQAHGATYKGKRLGSIGSVNCFSCYPTKNLGAIGDAGLITTNSAELAVKLRMLREYGWHNRISEFPGKNSRLDELQAAILRIKLKYLDESNEKRRQLADYYVKHLAGLPIQLPKIRSETEAVFHLFVIQVQNRSELMCYMQERGIQLGIHYPVPVHQQAAYKDRVRTAKDMHVTDDVANNIVSLPIYPELTFSEIDSVVNSMKEYFGQ